MMAITTSSSISVKPRCPSGDREDGASERLQEEGREGGGQSWSATPSRGEPGSFRDRSPLRRHDLILDFGQSALRSLPRRPGLGSLRAAPGRGRLRGRHVDRAGVGVATTHKGQIASQSITATVILTKILFKL